MAKRTTFDQEAAFKAIIGAEAEEAPKAEEKQSRTPKLEPEKTIIIAADKKEARSQRVNLLIKPSVLSAAKKKCKRLNISLNECMNQFLEKWSAED